ncbi:MAG: UDP-2,3-diacylglucosamine diphosphatase [Deltaproteobacteria bacterium]|nr:UDP-2,3-diacylglucosamine diphosphatase [Deltaproteobacteria bacterium]
MKAIFISDIHYQGKKDSRGHILLRFFEEKFENGDYLVIVGDFFDFWIGFPNYVYEEYREFLSGFEKIVFNKQIKIIYVEGNHDFFLGSYFSEKLKAHILSKPGIIHLFNKKIYLHHGDGIDKRSLLEKVILKFLKSRFVYVLARFLGPRLTWSVGTYLSFQSRRAHGHVDTENVQNQYRAYAKNILQKENADFCIIGHIHIPDEIELLPEKTYFNVGDWLTHQTYVEMKEGKIELKSYNSI